MLIYAGLTFAYATGKQRGRWQTRRVIEQGLMNGKVVLYGKAYQVTAIEFLREGAHESQ